jgi:hypothetical protein
MQLTGGVRMTKRHWLVLDLLAILFVAATVVGIIAVWIGAWWPFSSLLLPEWPLFAFFAWFLAGQHPADCGCGSRPREARAEPATP